MAIKVNGTTVINDSRNLQNVGGLKTVNGTSIVGSGNISAGASTTLGAVATYAFLRRSSSSGSYTPGETAAGSTLRYSASEREQTTSTIPSGTWQCMGYALYTDRPTVFVRIS